MEQITFEEILTAYDYQFPSELIAKEPASPRESAQLLIYDRKNDSVKFDIFENIIQYLPEDAVLVFNRTKVIPAKFSLKKSTGGMVSALFLEQKDSLVRVIASGKFLPGDTLQWNEGHIFTVVERSEKEAILQASFDVSMMISLLEKFGETPLPPYIKDSPLSEERRRSEYQTVFAKEKGSVAAPTAGLHFSDSLIKKVIQSGRSVQYITLHVGLGTFAPLTEEHWQKKELHREFYEIDPVTAEFLTKAKNEGRKIIAVGTTTVRALESAIKDNSIEAGSNSTTLFISEGNPLKFVDCLITNFHVPRSSLLMLVSAFTGREKLLEIYRVAIERKMRLFSFGDGMLIL